ncbi:tetratricopeptide repeat protein [Sorangium sp. So ce1097]|uniref:tetratricopeptide repeat protein n=1 Tax=Sorangium sp. So ce1097 TaxID=3133330 RepID=UPI003F63EBCC
MTARSPARARRRGAFLVVALLAATFPSSASAQGPGDVESARVLFVQGAKLAREGRWEEARALYARSLEIKPAPLTRYSLGVAQKELGQLAGALASFRAFLAEPPTPATAPYVGPAREAVAALEGRVGRATISVRPGNVDGLTLLVDGEPMRGSPGQAIELDPGAHEVVASAPGFRSTAARFTVVAGGSVQVPIALAPSATAAARAAGGGGLPPVADPSAASSRGALPIVVMGVGGAFFAGGALLGLSGLKQASDARSSADADASAARAKGIVGDVLGGVGLATVGVGLYLLLDDPAPSAPETGSVRPWLGASGSGIEVRF